MLDPPTATDSASGGSQTMAGHNQPVMSNGRRMVVLALVLGLTAWIVSHIGSDSIRGGPTPGPNATAAPRPTGQPSQVKVVGMSTPATLWSQRLAEVGPCGVEARRIFADLTSTGRDQSTLISQAVAAGMLPVISYKVPSVDSLNSGQYDTWLESLRTYLEGLGEQVAVTFWHEPHGDMTAAEFRAGSHKFVDRVKSPTVAVGPILNGWLLDDQVGTFASYTDAYLLAAWDFVAVDSYQSGTPASPGTKLPARAVPLLAAWLDSEGFPDKPIGLGEYNGFTADAVAAAGEAILSTPEVWFGLVWNSTERFEPLTGTRLEAFKATKADTRARQDC